MPTMSQVQSPEERLVMELFGEVKALEGRVRGTGLTEEVLGSLRGLAGRCEASDDQCMDCGSPLAVRVLALGGEKLGNELLGIGDRLRSKGSLYLASKAYQAAGEQGTEKLEELRTFCRDELGSELQV